MFVDPEGEETGFDDITRITSSGTNNESFSIAAVVGMGVEITIDKTSISIKPARGLAISTGVDVSRTVVTEEMQNSIGTWTWNTSCALLGFEVIHADAWNAKEIVGYSMAYPFKFLDFVPKRFQMGFGFYEVREGGGFGRSIEWCAIEQWFMKLFSR